MIAGAALLVLAAWSPFALLRLIPMMEIAAASVVMQRSSMSGAAGSAGVHSPASYMRQAMDRHSHGSASPGYPGAAGTIYSRTERSESERTATSATARDATSDRHTATSRSGSPSGGRGGATYAPSERPSTTVVPPRHEAAPPRTETPERRRPSEPPSDRRPPTEDR
jgi:hypothetical protein